MAGHGGGNSGPVGPDFNLPDYILSVIPTDPYDLLDLARKITSMAIASRVTKLESEADHLLQKIREKDRTIAELEDKLSHLDSAYQEIQLRLKITREDNIKLLNEKDSLALTAEKLRRNLAKLQNFKRQLMQSLNDENSAQTDTVDIDSYDQLVPKGYSTIDEDYSGYTKYHSFSSSSDSASTNDDGIAVKKSRQIVSVTPNITRRLTPSGTPIVISSSASPISYSSSGSPLRSSGTTSPTQYEGWSSVSSQYSSSQQSSGTTSPTLGRPPTARNFQINGKEFFRQARSRLSLDQFSAFLAYVKELNAQRQSREETLRKAEHIFGMDNKDLYVLFQGLLNHKVQ